MAMPKQKPGRSRQDYATPAVFVDAVKDYLGISYFEHDFAANAANSKGQHFFGERASALLYSRSLWEAAVADGWGWLNPPFSHIEPWAFRSYLLGRDGGRIAFLVPASVGSNWYRDFVHNKAFVLALNGRIAFDPTKPTWGYPKDCILALYGYGKVGFDVWTWK